MSFQDYVASQFEAELIQFDKKKGRVRFKTPMGTCTLSREDWQIVKNKILEVKV